VPGRSQILRGLTLKGPLLTHVTPGVSPSTSGEAEQSPSLVTFLARFLVGNDLWS
jgi:hypothetical protein